MTELEKKQSQRIYDARDPELRKQQNRAKELVRQYNDIPAENTEERAHILAELLGTFGKNVRVNQPVYVDYGYNIHLNDNSFVNMHCTLLDTAPIVIGECTMVGPDVKIYTAMHPLSGAERFWHQPDGDNVWIGAGAIILPGVTIGDNVVIGAGSVVTHSIPDNAVACGNPCKVRKWNPPLGQKDEESGKAAVS